MFRSGLLCMREIEIYAQRLNLSVSYQELPYLKPAPLSPCPPGCSPSLHGELAQSHRPRPQAALRAPLTLLRVDVVPALAGVNLAWPWIIDLHVVRGQKRSQSWS